MYLSKYNSELETKRGGQVATFISKSFSFMFQRFSWGRSRHFPIYNIIKVIMHVTMGIPPPARATTPALETSSAASPK